MMLSGKPIWPVGESTEPAVQVGFHAKFSRPAGRGPVHLSIAASSRYRAWVNCVFVGHGPARGPHGWFRVDRWEIGGHLRSGTNHVAIEVAGYNANSYYVLDQPSFLQAEILAGSKVLASTEGPGARFAAKHIEERLRKVQRYSFQRPFTEIWKLSEGWDRWRTEGISDPIPCAPIPPLRLLPHGAPLPKWEVVPPRRVLSEGRIDRGAAPRNPWKDRSLTAIGSRLKGFPERELEEIPSLELQALRFRDARDVDRPMEDAWEPLAAGRWSLLDFGVNRTGFPRLRLRCVRSATVTLLFDEILSEGVVDFKRLGCVNALRWHLEPGEYSVEAFEPYTLRYLQILAEAGDIEWRAPGLRELACPDAGLARFETSDPTIDAIFEAARQTFRQNAVDTFMDCPSRERAGWLCDSFWTARVAHALTGHTRIETCFLENFALPVTFAGIPDGMLPMCYPADHPDGVFIANWSLWFVLQLREYRDRGGDAALVARLRPRVERLLAWFEKLRNTDGLLERVPGWVFVEWSRANDFVQDVNYPSNMLYAAALEAAGDLYANPAWRAESAKLHETIRAQSFDGAWFVDNAVRGPGGLAATRNRSETCQYYAFFFGTADPIRHPELWRRLVEDFGPDRARKGLHSEIHPSNAFIGNYLRMELLARERRIGRILEETRSFFGYMAERTGTLWENIDSSASCNHGFASHVAWLLLRDVAGIRRIDPKRRTVEIESVDPPLDRCAVSLPLAGGTVKLAWRRIPGGFRRWVSVPPGWRAVTLPGPSGKLAR
ncbi:MAG: hypothetical protein ACKO5K_02790 [Armatimonadota bacterium]